MGVQSFQIFLWLVILPCHSMFDVFENKEDPMDKWVQRNSISKQRYALSDGENSCLQIHPANSDIIKRFTAILPYFDKDHDNSAFLHKLRSTLRAMLASEDLLDREIAFYATTLIPIVFLQQYRDTWCLLERFHRSLRLYQMSHPTEKRTALKVLQNLKAVNTKIRNYLTALPLPSVSHRETTMSEFDDDQMLKDKKDIRYINELIKNLG